MYVTKLSAKPVLYIQSQKAGSPHNLHAFAHFGRSMVIVSLFGGNYENDHHHHLCVSIEEKVLKTDGYVESEWRPLEGAKQSPQTF